MKVVALLAVAFAAIASSTAFAQQPTSMPYPDATPTGEFRVEPASGPVGTVVALTSNVDQEVIYIRFHCFYLDTADEGLVDQSLPAASSTFSTMFQIPATLPLRQRGGETRATPTGRCEFLAIAGHQLLGRAARFDVTAGLPTTGSGPDGGRPFAAHTLALLLGGALLAGAGFVARRRYRAA